jgi:hypothetical protein
MISTYPWRDRIRFFIPGMLLVAAIANIPVSEQQEQDYASESLFMAVFANGDTLVEYDVSIKDPLDEEIRIKLYGGAHISDLIVVDYDDELVDYDIGKSQNEIVLNTPGVPNIRISYTTPDLANRIQGIWTFSLNSTTSFSVRLPPDSVLIDNEPIPSSIRFFNNQPLLTFDKPGAIRVSYAIGVLGTEDQANIAIQVANIAIKETHDSHPGIVLVGAEDLVKKAIVALDGGKFAEAESLAGKANDAAIAAGRDYESAQSSIAEADRKIKQAASEGRDVSAAGQMFEQAKNEFASGNYSAAKNSADDAAGAIGSKPPDPQMPFPVIIAGAVAAAGGVGALVFLKMRKQPAMRVHRREPLKVSDNKTTIFRPPAALQEKEMEDEPVGVEGSLETENSLPLEPGTIPDSQIDKSVLGRIVSKVIEERPHLRPEDQDVLKFLAEREGAAFESEIRTKFQLPKTTIWRLVKRLEREELVEIRKAGGQNLIKFKFEDKLP